MKLLFCSSLLGTALLSVSAFAPQNTHRQTGVTTTSSSSSFVTVSSPSASSSNQNIKHRNTQLFNSNRVDITEGTPRDVQGLLEQWVPYAGIHLTEGAYELTATADEMETSDDYSVVTNIDLPAGSPVLYIPRDIILSANAVAQELDTARAVDALYRRGVSDTTTIQQFHLVLKILAEWEQGDESFYYPWLNAMPRLYYNAVSMTDVCLECLPPLVFSLGRVERVKLENFQQAMRDVDFLEGSTKTNVNLVQWAYNIVSTRAFPSSDEQEDMHILPMADMFNHGTDVEIEISYDEEGNAVPYTVYDVPAGSPLRMSYGDPTNPSALFAKYGFLDESSPATFCKLMTIKPTPELVDLGLDFSRMLFYKDTGDISEEVWDVVLYDCLTKQSKLDDRTALYEAHMNGDAETKAMIHGQYSADTVQALQDHVNGFLAQLDTLNNRAANRDINIFPRLPLIVRHNDFVKETFLTVKANLDAMAPSTTSAAGGEEYAESYDYSEYSEEGAYEETNWEEQGYYDEEGNWYSYEQEEAYAE